MKKRDPDVELNNVPTRLTRTVASNFLGCLLIKTNISSVELKQLVYTDLLHMLIMLKWGWNSHLTGIC